MDLAERVGNGTAGAHELVFDGVQDIVSVPLPAFLQSPSGDRHSLFEIHAV
jgi:hypothetical protein